MELIVWSVCVNRVYTQCMLNKHTHTHTQWWMHKLNMGNVSSNDISV